MRNKILAITLSTLTLTLSLPGAAKPPAPAPAPTPAFDKALLKPASLNEQAPGQYQVLFHTTRGDFTVRVTRAWAPLGADRFYNLAKHHYFDGTSFFRVLPGFVVQWGISPRPEIAKAWSKASLQDDPVTQSNRRGRITFATAGPHSRTTQIFINLCDNANLDTMGFAPFGEVDEAGMKIVDSFFSGYGEGAPRGQGPDQQRIEQEGQGYLDQNFSMLDRIKSTSISAGDKGKK